MQKSLSGSPEAPYAQYIYMSVRADAPGVRDNHRLRGFGAPKICVEVKSENSPIDRPTVDKLLGAVSKFGADEGLFVSWSGYKSNVQKELAASFFKVRLWSQKELLEQVFAHYDKLDEDLRAELPLKRIWTVAAQDDE